MKVDKVTLHWENTFKGYMETPQGKVLLGDQPLGQRPYPLLLSALGSCFYATFLEIASKLRVTFDRATIELEGNKRDQEVATLEHVIMVVRIKNPSDEKKLTRCVDLGAKFCSIHETIKQIATIDIQVIFE